MKTLFTIINILVVYATFAQVPLDLSIKSGSNQTILTKEKYIRLINCSKQNRYKVEWAFMQNLTPEFKDVKGNQSTDDCGDDYVNIKKKLEISTSEDTIKKYVDLGRTLLETLTDPKCVALLKAAIAETEQLIPIPYAPLKDNQVITLTVTKVDKDGKQVGDSKWTFVLKTPEKSRWLIHYGLTYAPSVISKTNHYYSLADTSVANRYTITKENKNGPRPWENISATINFTYPFHSEPRGFDGGFTAGFGLSAGLELSGQAGLSMIIGDNVIVGTGIAMMQKYKLYGKYKEGQIIKENLDFNALHEKVWLPELYFTIGFRFGNNPFAKKSDAATNDGKKEEKPE
ncbi:MAG: hypothetical protein JST21_02305 [Bacteroidetes bacterium]|nr:hypothetical protein [Bacteroidota bacterium]